MTGAPARRRKRAAGLLKDPAEPSEEEEEGFENPDSLEEDFRRREELIMVMAETDTEELIPLGHAFEDFVLGCTYRGIPCG